MARPESVRCPRPTFLGAVFADAAAWEDDILRDDRHRASDGRYRLISSSTTSYSAWRWLPDVFAQRMRRLPVGRAWEALREDETACQALLGTTATKLSGLRDRRDVRRLRGPLLCRQAALHQPRELRLHRIGRSSWARSSCWVAWAARSAWRWHLLLDLGRPSGSALAATACSPSGRHGADHGVPAAWPRPIVSRQCGSIPSASEPAHDGGSDRGRASHHAFLGGWSPSTTFPSSAGHARSPP